MKKIYLISFLTLFLFSCQNEEFLDTSNDQNLKLKIIDELKSSNYEVHEYSNVAKAYFSTHLMNAHRTINLNETSEIRRQMFKTFDSKEKKKFWELKLYDLLVNNDFNESQVIHILKLFQFCNEKIFIEVDNSLLNSFRDEWTSKAEKIFSKDQVFLIAYSFISPQNITSKTSFNFNTNDCHCLSESRYTCGRVTQVGGGISIEYGSCGGFYCDTTTCCCGFLGAYGCDGNQCSYGGENP